MRKLLLPVLLFLLLPPPLRAQSSSVILDYIATYKDIAIEEMIRTGVPAAITLAQGIHETEAGRSKLVLKSNNHFGIKCKTGWTGESVSHDDDAKGECFRKYADPAESYKDHSDFLRNRAHYASLFTLDPADFEAWAHGLKKAGYATNPKYPQVLIKLIKDYKLQEYTLVALGRKVMDDGTQITALNGVKRDPGSSGEIAPTESHRAYPEGVFKINRTNVVFVRKGVSYLALAELHRIPLHRLFEFNDMLEAEATLNDRLVYLQRKRREGATDFHIVGKGETIYDIAQAEGIQLESLLSYNYLRSDVKPTPGRKLYLTKDAAKEEEKRAGTPNPAHEKERGEVREPFVVHTVQVRQSLYAIARMYQVKIDELREWNGIEGDGLKTGQQLRINKK